MGSEPEVSGTRWGRALLRVAGRRGGENRVMRALYHGGNTALRNVSRVLHVLWLEVTGLLFLVLAFVGGGAAVHEYNRYRAGEGAAGKMALAALFTIMFGYFGVSSFWRSKKK